MRIAIVAVGRARGDATQPIVEDYLGRLPWQVSLVEIAPSTRAREGIAIVAAVKQDDDLVVLESEGATLSSEAFAQRMQRFLESGRGLVFAIGGADGLAEIVRMRANLTLSFGPMTWPHMLARVMLAEQLWRAHAILAGHPYHRGH
jgi:23S rRNA (pseudouridine1915-N3)-methyltransferase